MRYQRLWTVFDCKQLLLLLLLAAPAAAHDVDVTGVARVLLDQTGDNEFSLSVVDQQVPPLFDVTRILPAHCEGLTPGNFSYRFSCNPTLNAQDTLHFPWSLQGVVVVAHWQDGNNVSGYFPGDGTTIPVPLGELQAAAGSLSGLAWRYLVLGAEHILFGIDHLLFILGLLLLQQGGWKLLQTITAFTLAHSITLAFAVLQIFPLPNAPVEVLIALSIALLAREIVMGQRGQYTLVHQWPWAVAFVFGLFHGFGFAGALGELGLSPDDVPLALLFFNLGVEAGQVAFIGALLAIRWLLNRTAQTIQPAVERALAYGLGGIATFWFLERLPALAAT